DKCCCNADPQTASILSTRNFASDVCNAFSDLRDKELSPHFFYLTSIQAYQCTGIRAELLSQDVVVADCVNNTRSNFIHYFDDIYKRILHVGIFVKKTRSQFA